MRSIISFVGLVFGGVIVVTGLYQAFGVVNPLTGIDLVRVYSWSMVALAGTFFMGYVALKHVFSPTTNTRRPQPPTDRPSIPSQYSRTKCRRN